MQRLQSVFQSFLLDMSGVCYCPCVCACLQVWVSKGMCKSITTTYNPKTLVKYKYSIVLEFHQPFNHVGGLWNTVLYDFTRVPSHAPLFCVARLNRRENSQTLPAPDEPTRHTSRGQRLSPPNARSPVESTSSARSAQFSEIILERTGSDELTERPLPDTRFPGLLLVRLRRRERAFFPWLA